MNPDDLISKRVVPPDVNDGYAALKDGSLMWRKDNNSLLLAEFAGDVKSMVQRRDGRAEILG